MKPLRHAAALALLTTPAALAQPDNPTVTDPDRAAVIAPHVARRFFSLAENRRVDIVLVGDSNTRNSIISGHEDGMARALSARFGCYATRVDPGAAQGGWGAGVGGCATYQFAPFLGGGAPPAPAQYVFPADGALPIGAVYLPPGVEAPWHYNGGFAILPDHPVDIAAQLRYHLTHYRWRTPTDGFINITVRENTPGDPAHNYATAHGVRTAAATPGLADLALDVPRGPRPDAGILCCPTDLGNALGARGPFFGLWHRVENTDRPAGISYSPLVYRGGRSARFACEELARLGPAAPALREWLRQIARLQGPSPVLLVQIIHGGNDAGDYNLSCGLGLVSRTPEGHADNMLGIIRFMREAWAGIGHDADNLYFLLGPYHPQDDRLGEVRSYEDVWARLAATESNIFGIRGTWISSQAEFAANGWHQSPTDFAHLSVAGYRAWGTAAVEVLQRAVCPADLDHDRADTVEDLFLFLEAFFAAAARADHNRDALLTIEDLFEFLTDWAAGCG